MLSSPFFLFDSVMCCSDGFSVCPSLRQNFNNNKKNKPQNGSLASKRLREKDGICHSWIGTARFNFDREPFPHSIFQDLNWRSGWEQRTKRERREGRKRSHTSCQQQNFHQDKRTPQQRLTITTDDKPQTIAIETKATMVSE